MFEKGQEERATCFSILLQKELNSDVARVTTHESNLSRNERGSRRLGKVVAKGRDYVYFLQQPLYVHAACMLAYMLAQGKLVLRHAWHDFRVILSNQKSVFSQIC